MKHRLANLAIFAALLVSVAWCGAARAEPPAAPDAAGAARAFLKQHCQRCHGADRAEGELRLHQLAAPRAGAGPALDIWAQVLERLEAGDMPPRKELQPARQDVEQLVAWLRAELKSAGRDVASAADRAFPAKANLLDHAMLFAAPADGAAASDARLWRVSPFGYLGLMQELSQGKLNIRKESSTSLASPFGLASDHGFRDYAFRYRVSASETEQLALNAKKVIASMLESRPTARPPQALAAIVSSTGAPTAEQIDRAVNHLFEQALRRPPSAEERERYAGFLAKNVAQFGNRDGLIRGLAPVLLHPEAVFRVELGDGAADRHGRVALSPLELATALSLALTDQRPDATLLRAAREGNLATPADARREVERMLKDAALAKPRILRFFQEYFGYADAPGVFKDEPVIRAAGFGRYSPQFLVEDTDALVLLILKEDRQVLRELLITDRAFVASDTATSWVRDKAKREDAARKTGQAPPAHPFNKKNQLNDHYNVAAERWTTEQPLRLPQAERAGILTQPAWLTAHSTNTDNHAILRGKWIRDRLLGGSVPDTPITVEAKLPDEPEQTLRHRMRVTRERYCWQCHQNMDPLGLPFEMFDHFGRHRTQELRQPVNTSGAIIASGDAALDGPVKDAVAMIRKLAESERVHQVFVRHAFRYWLGRNETADDAPTLQAAYRAYRDSDGSMNALIVSLLSSDSFVYRRVTRP
ncbi:MAG: DUF1588 domain-containing protein [Planctomycetia bacterium]|nr:DUF1588 domain-containing protein [Planctomycetia bacterium]